MGVSVPCQKPAHSISTKNNNDDYVHNSDNNDNDNNKINNNDDKAFRKEAKILKSAVTTWSIGPRAETIGSRRASRYRR